MRPLAHTGLALAAGLAAIAHAIILATILGNRLQGLLWPALGASLARTGIALLPVIGLCTWMASLPLWQEAGQSPQKMAWLLLAIGGSAIGYFGLHQLLRSDELTHLKLILQRRMPRKSPQ